MEILLRSLLLYLFGFPFIIWVVAIFHKRVIVAKIAERNAKRKSTKPAPTPMGKIIKKNLRVTISDKRTVSLKPKIPFKKTSDNGSPTKGIKRNLLWWILWGVGLAVALLSVISYEFIFLSFGIFIIAIFFGVFSPRPLINAREAVVDRMYEIVSSKLGWPASDPASNYVSVTEWRDYVEPNRVTVKIPTAFSEAGEDGFMKLFNQVFGAETAWVPEFDEENGSKGWDYKEGKLSLKAVPPLPTSAPWDARYIEDPSISPTFFPVAIGVENGTTITDKDDPTKVEHVLGFDLSGKQKDYAQKAGETIAAKMCAATPMVFIGGATGGGKALSVDEKVLVIRRRG